MSGPENILQRWSRRKREAADSAPISAGANADKSAAAERRELDPSKTEASKSEGATFDVSKLPPVESIGADSDVRAFMQPGVPPELKHAALRRAWSADNEIRDFIGLVENGWDFNDPHGVPGFGPLNGEDVAQLLAQAVGAPEPGTAPGAESCETVAAPETSETATSESGLANSTKDLVQATGERTRTISDDTPRQRAPDTAMQDESAVASTHPAKQRRGHGGALPT